MGLLDRILSLGSLNEYASVAKANAVIDDAKKDMTLDDAIKLRLAQLAEREERISVAVRSLRLVDAGLLQARSLMVAALMDSGHKALADIVAKNAESLLTQDEQWNILRNWEKEHASGSQEGLD